MLGARRHQAQGRLPNSFANTSICTARSPQGWHLRLSDHADFEHGMLSDFPRRAVAQVCQAGYPAGARWRPQPSQRRAGVPDNITLLFLPPYAPELNPKENLWEEIREKIFKNYALKSMDAVRQKLKEAILYIERNPQIVKSITSFPYIAKSF